MRALLVGILAMLIGGCSYLGIGSSSRVLHYQCGTMPLTVTLTQDRQTALAAFLLDGKRLRLPQTPSASGARYSDGAYVFWTKGTRAFIQRGEKVIVDDCVLTS